MSHRADPDNDPVADLPFLAGGGAMGERMRAFDWAATPLGPPQRWSQSLRASIGICLDTQFPIALYWGPEAILLYNDAWRPILGDKHEQALGRPGREVWSEIWDVVGPVFERAMTAGAGSFFRDALLSMHRFGYTEECYFDYTFSPVRGANGAVEGVFNAVTETTYRVLAERRGRLVRDFAARTAAAKTAAEACRFALEALAEHRADVPFALVWLLDDGPGARACLHGATGIDAAAAIAPPVVDLQQQDGGPWPLAAAVHGATPQRVALPPDLIAAVHAGPWPEAPREALVLPVQATGVGGTAAVLVAGVNPRRELDDGYRELLRMLAEHLATALANARAYEQERRRAEALAELDRAKTAFFGNVSHEFRTPLTLMLGPLEDLLAGAAGPEPDERLETLAIVHRNANRLLRLVNRLLDVSRIEAGRVQASYQPTDLAAWTADLASMFRAATERAGLSLVVDCEPLGEPVHVDREMWEKIVLNLLSNAFKFTFEGAIEVTLRRAGDRAVLRVRDTGIGIPAAEMPRLFERFHRIENARARTHEGSGIGLAFVQELVRLHGGTVTAQSEPGSGTTFEVAVPFGTAHLPRERVARDPVPAAAPVAARAFVEEALRWLPDAPLAAPDDATRLAAAAGEDGERPLVLVADDNADMRRYVARLLDGHYRVATVADGEAALAAARQRAPDLVLADVMMPRRDGFALVAALRADAALADVPVLLLSARAGEEARIEGMQAGADDYLVKPFSARELLARVGAHLQMTRLRRAADQAVRQKSAELARIMDTAAVGLVRCSRDLVCLSANRAYAELAGVPLDRIVGRPLVEVLGERGLDAVRPELERVLAGERVEYEAEVPFPNAQRRFVRVHYVPELDEHGAVVGWVGSLLDITGRRRAEEQLRASHDTFLRLIQDAPFGVYLVDQDFRLAQVSAGAQGVFANVRPLLGRDFADVLRIVWPEPFASEAMARFRHTLQSGEPFRSPDTVERRGDTRIVESYDWQLQRVSLPGGRFGVVCYFYDMTQRRRAEVLVQEQSRVLAMIARGEPLERCFEELCVGIERIDPAIRAAVALTDASRGRVATVVAPTLPLVVARVLGRPLDDAALDTFVRAIRTGATVTATDVAGGEPWHPDWLALCREQGIRACVSTPFGDATSEPRGTVFLCFDVAKEPADEDRRIAAMAAGVAALVLRRDEAEAALRASEQRFKLMADTTPAMLWISDDAHRATFLSAGWGEYTGQSSAESLGDGWLAAVHPDDRDAMLAAYTRAAAARVPFAVDYRLRRSDGSYRWAIDAGRPRFDENGAWLGYIGAVIDVHERKQAEEALQEQTRRLEEEDRRKDLFLATLGHELRNPLAALHSAMRLLELGQGDPAWLHRMMDRQVHNLKEMVGDLLEISRITRGKVELHRAPMDLVRVVESAAEAVRSAIARRRQALDLDLPPAFAIDGDALRLEQVVTNLLSNACKFSPDGARIEVALLREAGHAVLQVRDPGLGLRPEQLRRIFEPFAQEDPGSGGLGLGLALVEQLVRLHGGTVEAASDGPGRGSVFTVRLPEAPAAAPAVPAPALVPAAAAGGDAGGAVPFARLPRPLRILVVDDHRDNAQTLALLLRLAGAETTCAFTGQEAIDAVHEFVPEVALVDIALPDMTGYDVARRIRERANGNGVLLLAVTGFGDPIAEARARDAGFAQRLLKPVDLDHLHAVISQHVAQRPNDDR